MSKKKKEYIGLKIGADIGEAAVEKYMECFSTAVESVSHLDQNVQVEMMKIFSEGLPNIGGVSGANVSGCHFQTN